MPDRLILFMYESWSTLDAQMERLTAAELTTRYDGGSAIAWSLGHVTTMLDSWINTRFQGLTPNPIISNPNFRNGGNGEARDWPAIEAAVQEVRRSARRYLDAMSSPDLEQVIPYDGSIEFIRPIGLRLSYAIMRITAHHFMHAGEVATIRGRLGHPEGLPGRCGVRCSPSCQEVTLWIDKSEPGRAHESDDKLQPDFRPYMTAYVDRMKESGALNEPAVEQAFRRVPRHLFVERFFVGDEDKGWTPVEHDPTRPKAEHLETIYSGAALITRLEGNLPTSSTSQPGLVADMLQLLEFRPGMRVLEVGAGTGYNAALMAELVGDPALVATIDIQEDVVEDARRSLTRAGYPGIRVLCQDGFEGAPEAAPFDRIVATVGCPDISPQWVKQLAPSGSMLIPLRHASGNPLVRAWREGGEVVGRVVGSSGFMAIRGKLWDEHYLDLSQPPRNADEEERSVWPEFATAPGPQSERRWGQSRTAFWFFLGLRDRRTRLFRWFSSFGLDDKPSGRTARLEANRLVGDPRLLDELDAFYQEWRALDTPDIRRFRVRFVPTHSSGQTASPQVAQPEAEASEQHTWTASGPFYRREFSLDTAQTAHGGPARP